ncbi:MAG: VWA domain-containing protein, partial [Chloroflexi bacterium]|nr:VWA domain-containing protein [Chloroflexota bacterium]
MTTLLAIPIILLYMLRLRRRPVSVPSLLLWEAAARDRHANRPWQKLRRNWLLALQLLVLLALTLALARPALPAPMAVHGQAILLLDVSASMQAAHPDGGTRFEAAVRELHDVAATLSPADTVTLITVEARPRLWLRGGDARALRQALDEIAPTDGPANWQAAAALAAGSAAGEEVTTLLVTDAAISAPIPALPGDVRVLPVGGEQANVGVVAFSLRRHDGGWTAFVRLHNAGPATSREVTLTADGSVVAHRALDLPAEEDVALTFADVPVTAWAEVQLNAAPPTQDAFRLDDRAWVAFSANQAASVLLVTPGNRFLQQALRSLPGTELATTDTLPEGDLAASAPGLT